jgi:hypothetical protein
MEWEHDGTDLTVEQARAWVTQDDSVSCPSVVTLTEDVAAVLTGAKGYLSLDGLESMSLESLRHSPRVRDACPVTGSRNSQMRWRAFSPPDRAGYRCGC